jgi:hypothetical protein
MLKKRQPPSNRRLLQQKTGPRAWFFFACLEAGSVWFKRARLPRRRALAHNGDIE